MITNSLERFFIFLWIFPNQVCNRNAYSVSSVFFDNTVKFIPWYSHELMIKLFIQYFHVTFIRAY